MPFSHEDVICKISKRNWNIWLIIPEDSCTLCLHVGAKEGPGFSNWIAQFFSCICGCREVCSLMMLTEVFLWPCCYIVVKNSVCFFFVFFTAALSGGLTITSSIILIHILLRTGDRAELCEVGDEIRKVFAISLQLKRFSNSWTICPHTQSQPP